jgi:hypothetical protein
MKLRGLSAGLIAALAACGGASDPSETSAAREEAATQVAEHEAGTGDPAAHGPPGWEPGDAAVRPGASPGADPGHDAHGGTPIAADHDAHAGSGGIVGRSDPAARSGPVSAAHAGHPTPTGTTTVPFSGSASGSAAAHAGHDSPPAAAARGPSAPTHAGHGAEPSPARVDVTHQDHASSPPAQGGRSAAGAPSPAEPHAAHVPGLAISSGAGALHRHDPSPDHGGPGGGPGRGLEGLLDDLLADPEVQRRIEADPRLRELWADPGVRAHLEPAMAMSPAMAALQTLLRHLLADPEVLARIEADPALRALWRDEAVRRHLPAAPGP